MRFWAGVTDNSWYEFLAGRGLDEVNFWQPSVAFEPAQIQDILQRHSVAAK